MSESVLRIVIDSRNAEQNARNLSRELNSIEKNGDFATKSMDSMSVSTRALAGYMAGIITVSGAIAKADGYTQQAARIRNATASAEEYDLVQNRVLATAKTTFRDLSEAQEVYLSLAGGMKDLGKNTSETLDLVDSLSFSFTHNATRTDQAQSAMDSLAKSMAKGKIDADAWISIVTGANNIIADMAKTTGMSGAEIRKLGATGKISLEDLIKTLIATRDQNENLANSMENSFKDGLTNLSTAVTVYLGKANEATSATGILAGGLGLLADNLEGVANVAMLGGVAYLTKTIIAQTVATQGAITKSVQRRASLQAEMVAHTQALGLEVQRTRQISALALTEVHLARQELNSATTRQARVAATMRLTQAEVALAIAQKQTTASTSAQTVAENALNASRSRSAMLLGLVGGPIGAITLGVTALAAGYMYMSSKGNKANEMLESQSQYASMAADELNRLDGAQRKAAQEDLSKELGILNNKLKASENQFESLVEKVLDSNKTNVEAKRIWSELRVGAIGVGEAYTRLNQTDFVTSDQINQLSESKKKVDDNKVAVKATNQQLDQVKTSGANAKKGFKDAANGAKDAQKEVATLNKDLADFNKTLQNREFEAQFSKQLLNKGLSEGQTKAMLEVANAAREKGVTATKEMYKEALRIYNLEKGVQDTIEAKNKLLKENTNELSKQQKVLQVNSKVQANAAKYNFSGLEAKNGLPAGLLSAVQMQESKGSTYNSKGGVLKSPVGAAGSFQFMPATAKRFNVNVEDMASSAQGAATYLGKLLKMFNGDIDKAIMAYNAGEGNVQTGKAYGFKETKNYLTNVKGYMAGSSGFKTGDINTKDFEKLLEDSAKLAEQQAELRKSLELDVANEVTRIRTELKDKLEQVDTAGFSVEKAKEVKAKLEAQADSEIAIAEYALKSKLDDFENFKKTESQLLKDSFDEKKFYAAHDIELSANQKDQAIQFLDEQYQHELALIELAKEERIFQMQQGLMHANAASEKYWSLERDRIVQSTMDLDERNRKLAISLELQAQEKRNNLNNAVQQWGQTEADMSGTGEQYQLEQERFGRYDESQDLFDAQMALAETAAQREAIWQAHHDRMTMIEADYYLSSQQLQLAGMGQIASGLSSIIGDMAGEQSAAYKAMFAIEKGFAIAQSALAIQMGVSKAIALGFPQNIPVIAQTVMEGAKIASAIKSITTQGFETGGYTGSGGRKDVAGVVHGQEYVLNAQATKRVGVGTLDAINSGKSLGGGGGGDVKISQYITFADGGAKVDTEGQKEIAQSLNNAMDSWARRESRQGGVLYKLTRG